MERAESKSLASNIEISQASLASLGRNLKSKAEQRVLQREI